MCATGGSFDRRRELRLGELIVSVFMLFTLEGLFHSLRVYDFLDLLRGFIFGGGLPDPICIAKSDSV